MCVCVFVSVCLGVIVKLYRAFHGFGQAKFPNGCLILGTSQFLILPQLPKKIDAQFKSGQN